MTAETNSNRISDAVPLLQEPSTKLSQGHHCDNLTLKLDPRTLLHTIRFDRLRTLVLNNFIPPPLVCSDSTITTLISGELRYCLDWTGAVDTISGVSFTSTPQTRKDGISMRT